MTDRVLSVRLQLEVAAARRAAKEMARDLRGIGDAADGSGRAGAASLNSFATAAKSAGKATAAVGGLVAGGMAVATASVVKGGMAYNTLEQTSRAALKTVLGSASAATNQMEALREFGKTSPFPRQIWISAQQQLLAFGMSAEKVIPTFSALQDAVAAAGGGGQQISEVVNVLAQVQSTGKVGADTLNELGVRGIDAATLIGDAMGKTAAEVRADISAQAISGVDFIDQLTAAMAGRFGGAAAGVKETWAGAVDRIKGAVRDIGGILASPLIDPEGGGAAVEWANGVADALRALETRLTPLIAALRERAEPAVEALSLKLEALTNWIKNADFSAIGSQIQAMLPAIVGVTAGFGVMGAKSLPIIGDLVSGLRPLPVALIAAAMASPELRRALFDLLAAAGPLLTAAANLATTLAGALGPALSAVAAVLQPVIAVVGFLADRFADLPDVIQMVIVGLVAWKALGVGQWLLQTIGPLRAFNEQMKVHSALAAMSGQQVGTMGAAYSVAATRVDSATKKVSAASVGIRGAMTSAASFMAGPWGAAIGIAATALGILTAAQQDAQTATEEFNVEVERSTGALTAGSVESIYKWAAAAETLTDNGAHVSDVLKDFGLTANDLTGYLLGNADATEKVNAALASHDSVAERNAFKHFLDITKGKIDDQTRVQLEAAAAGGKFAGATKDGANAAAGASSAYTGLAGALGSVGSASDDAATRAQQLTAVLGGIYDSQFAAQEASDKFQGGLLSLKDAFAGNEKAAGKSASSSDKYSDSLKRQQKIVRDTQKQLEDLAEAQREAEKEAAEAAKAARQRALDELFGKTFNTQATMDAFRTALAQAGADISDAKGTAGATSLSGFSEGALANRERMRGLVQAAQAAIQAEKDQGASKQRIAQVTAALSDQLLGQAKSWGLNTAEVKQYTDAIRTFGSLANQDIKVDLSGVTKDFAEQRREIQENSAEQLDNARASAASAAATGGASAATKFHTATLEGNSESAIKNRDLFRDLVKSAQDELTQMHLNGAGREELKAKGEALALQLEREAIQLGFTKEDVAQYTDAVRVSAEQVSKFPKLNARADVAGAMVTVQNFVAGVNKQLAKIKKNFEIGVVTGSEYINSIGGGKQFLTNADGGRIQGQGGQRQDNILSWVSPNEYVVSARNTARNLPLLERINAGEDLTRELPAFASGGRVDPISMMFKGRPTTGLQQLYDGLMRDLMPFGAATGAPLQWAASQVGKPYRWGGVGPEGYDCSGFMSAITNVIQGRGPHARRFATGAFPTGDFQRGPGNFMIGSRRGNPGHMAGTLRGVNVESRGGEGVVMGKRARGAFDSLFGGNVWHLKGYADGGQVSGDPPFDLISPLGKHFDELVKGSYATGTDYVPMDGLYQLHQGEKVVPAAQNAGGTWVLEVRGDGSKASDFVLDSVSKGVETGRIRLVKK